MTLQSDIVTELNSLNTAKEAIKTALRARLTVLDSDSLISYAGKIDDLVDIIEDLEGYVQNIRDALTNRGISVTDSDDLATIIGSMTMGATKENLSGGIGYYLLDEDNNWCTIVIDTTVGTMTYKETTTVPADTHTDSTGQTTYNVPAYNKYTYQKTWTLPVQFVSANRQGYIKGISVTGLPTNLIKVGSYTTTMSLCHTTSYTTDVNVAEWTSTLNLNPTTGIITYTQTHVKTNSYNGNLPLTGIIVGEIQPLS